MGFQKIVNRKFFGLGWLDIFLLLAAATIPWKNSLNSQMLILFCIAGAFENSSAEKKRLLLSRRAWIFSAVYFLVLVASTLWDPNGTGAFLAVGKSVSFLMLPLILASLPPLKKEAVKATLLGFVFSTVLACLVCVVRSGLEYRHSGEGRIFYYQYLAGQIDINAIYLSLYSTFSILILLYYFFFPSTTARPLQKAIAAGGCLFLCVMVVFLSSKMVMFLLLATGTAALIRINYSKRSAGKWLLVIVLLYAGSALLLWQLPYVQWRLKVTEMKNYTNAGDDQNGWAVRKKIWESSMELIRQRPVLGYGVRFGNEKLIEKYKEDDFRISIENRYNCHNVYLQTALNTGLLGLVPLAGLLVVSVITAVRRKSFLFCAFLFLVLAQSITESMLEIQKGIVFLLLFLFLFLYHEPALPRMQPGHPSAA